mgnify:CR=1 FL=1
MTKKTRKISSLLATLGVFMAACATTPEPGHGEGGETFSPTRVVPLVEARRNAIQLELKIQDLFTREYGVGQWNPPQKNSQVTASSKVTCPDGHVTESWDFATAGPIKESQWRQAVERVYRTLKPLGYDKPGVRQIRNSRRNDHIAEDNSPTSPYICTGSSNPRLACANPRNASEASAASAVESKNVAIMNLLEHGLSERCA